MSQAKRQALPFAARMTACYRDWKKLLAERGLHEKANWVLVDDLCDTVTTTPSFNDDSEVREELQELLDICRSLSEKLGNNYAYTEAKLRQSLIYAQQTGTERITRAGAEARGVKWITVPETVLVEMHAAYLNQKAIADAFLLNKGQDPKKYYAEWLPGAEAASYIKAVGDEWVARFQESFTFIPTVKYECVALDIDMPFQNLVVCDREKFTLLMNTRTEKSFNRAHLTFLALHEICGHIVHFTHMRNDQNLQIDASQLMPLAIHTQDSFLVEGVAQILSMVVHARYADQFPEVGAQIQVSNLFVAVRHANISDLIDRKITSKEAAERHAKYLGGDISALALSYDARMNDAFGCIQALNYYSSIHMLSPYLNLSYDDQKKSLSSLMKSFLAPDDVTTFLSSLVS